MSIANKLRVEVDGGQILLNSVSVLIDRPDFKLLAADGESKYAEVMAYGYPDEQNGIEIYLGANERTLDYCAESDKYTTVRVLFDFGENKNWTLIAEWSRYTLFIAIFPITEGIDVWVKEA
jgi:hypothetical protein